MVHNEDIKKNIDQIQSYVAVMSIFLDFMLKDFLNDIENKIN